MYINFIYLNIGGGGGGLLVYCFFCGVDESMGLAQLFMHSGIGA